MFLDFFFKLSPSLFLRSYTIAVPSDIPSGLELVNLAEVNSYCCIVRLNTSFSISTLYAQCLIPKPNMENCVKLERNANYFFTSELSGCQILIYKMPDGDIYIEHNNYYDDSSNYNKHYNDVLSKNPIVIHAIHQVREFTSYGIEYPKEETRCIVGVRNGNNWTFYVKSPTHIDLIEIAYD